MSRNELGQTVPECPEDLPPIDPTTIAPLNKKGVPDMYNHMPTRFVTQDEARKRGWLHFYIGNPCRYGHLAPRAISNARLCIDCARITEGKSPIGGKVPSNVKRKVVAKTRGPAIMKALRDIQETAEARKPAEPILAEKRFLKAYAETLSFEKAAAEADMSEADVEARISYSRLFREALEDLEGRLQIRREYKPRPTKYEWTDEKRDRLIEVYVDTGDLASARDSIAVTPSEYFREIERNGDFQAKVLDAEPRANQALEERAVQLALAGNDKLLQKLLSVKKPEYRDNIKVEMDVTERLDDRQLQARLTKLISKLRPIQIIEGRADPVIEDTRGDRSTEATSQDRPVLQLSRDKVPVS